MLRFTAGIFVFLQSLSRLICMYKLRVFILQIFTKVYPERVKEFNDSEATKQSKKLSKLTECYLY